MNLKKFKIHKIRILESRCMARARLIRGQGMWRDFGARCVVDPDDSPLGPHRIADLAAYLGQYARTLVSLQFQLEVDVSCDAANHRQ